MPNRNNGITSRSAKANVRARTQQRHKKLLEGKGVDPKSNVATPRPKRKKVKSVQTQAIKDRATNKTTNFGPKPGLRADNSGIKNLGVKKQKVKSLGIKKKPVAKQEIKASGSIKKSGTSKSYNEQFKDSKKPKKLGRAKKVMDKADKAAKSGNLRKAARLERRSIRKAERASGKRKTAAGTALKGFGLGIGRSLARLGGYAGKFEKGLASKKKR